MAHVMRDSGDFNPENPGDPGEPDTTKTYTLTAEVTPSVAGYTSPTSTTVTEGTSVTVRAYNYSNYVFQYWTHADTIVSTSTSIKYVMPAEDVTLTAVFEYNPDDPDDPDEAEIQPVYTLTTTVTPSTAGSTSPTSSSVTEGTSVSVYVSKNSNYVFQYWTHADTIVSTSTSFKYVMPAEDVTLTAVLEYDPDAPDNPGANYYDSTTGEVIVDDFTAGSLASAIDEVIGGSSYRKTVTMVTVIGSMRSSDFSFVDNLTNCNYIDLTRTYGFTEVPSSSFDATNLVTVKLPSVVESIGNKAFYDCASLTSLSVYAVTPPSVGTNAFYGIPDGLVVYVPAASVSIYSETEVWEDFTILPLEDDVYELQVSLPDDASDGRYKDMTLELVNSETGQRYKYVITDRTVYTFNSLMSNTSYNVYVKNASSAVLGTLSNVQIVEDDVQVAFESLLQPQDVLLSVLAPDGTDLTSQTTITWLDSLGNYLKQGSQLTGQIEGAKLSIRIALSQTLAMLYETPSDTTWIVTDGDNNISLTLEAFPEAIISGAVKDVSTKLAISGAVVTVSQVLNDKYTKTYTTKTNSKGTFSQEVLGVMSTLTVSSSDYVSVSIDSIVINDSTDVGTISLEGIEGVTITTSFTYTESVAEGEESSTINYYSDYANISYSIYDITQSKEISEFSVQYPQIVLLEEVEDGDMLQITASSKKSAFTDVVCEVTVADGSADATFDIVELGGISASFTSTDNVSVVGILYDANGQLIKKYTYSDATLTINDLADGTYSLVSMGSSTYFNSILNLTQLSSAGLTEGTDYLRNDVEVKSGIIEAINNDVVPTLDESLLYYTGDNTTFTVNKTSIVSGNYLTLKAKIDFKSDYSSDVENVSLVVDLPESCSFVENSVMVGSSLSSYIIDGSRITIPISDLSDQVRFCVIPTLGGDYSPNAFANFTLSGSELLQPIGSATFTVSDLSITVPSIIAKTSLTVSGTATGNSSIVIYEDNTVIGETTSLANGTWSATCELDEPYNLSTHSIYAEVTTPQGLQLQTETSECFYDRDAVEVSKVTMYHDNPEMNTTYEVVFDFLNPSTESQTYIYYIYNKEFTFTIEFTDNDTTKVSNVILYVETGLGNIRSLEADFDANLGYWVASGQFGNMYDGDIPVNVSVDFVSYSDCVLDTLELRDSQYLLADVLEEMNYLEIDSLITECDEMLSSESPDYDAISDKIQSVMDLIDIGDVELSETDEAFVDSLLAAETEEQVQTILTLITVTYPTPTDEDSDDWDFGRGNLENDIEEINVPIDNGNDIICTYKKNTDYDDTGSTKSGYDSYATEGVWIPDTTPYETGNLDDETANKITLTNSVTGDVIEIDFNGNLDSEYVESDESISYIGDVSTDILSDLQSYLSTTNDQLLSYQETIDNLNHRIAILEETYRVFEDLNNAVGEELIDLGIDLLAELLEELSSLENVRMIYRAMETARGVIDLISTINDIRENQTESMQSQTEWILLIGDIYTHCDYDEAQRLEQLANNYLQLCRHKNWLINSCHVGSATLTIVGLTGAVETAGATLFLALSGLTLGVVTNWLERWSENDNTRYYNGLIDEINSSSKCTPLDSNEGPGAYKSGNPNAIPEIDPSGYVYEGVSSNRLEGVTATCYYKETLEDMYGDQYEVVDVWDASAYAQENPLFTDENGMYRWDVPEGLWQVKFEKDGYVTTYSEWLPVPPPQLEVNIAMTQNLQPDVQAVNAYEEGIEVLFDKYMQPSTLTTDYIYAIVADTVVAGEITLIDEEVSYEGETDTYASKVRFVPTSPFLYNEEVTLTVSRKVKSYAGVQMENDFSQTFDIQKEVKSLVVDSIINVAYGGEKTITISALPYDAAVGRTMIAKTSSSIIASVSADTLTLDDNGQATITIKGVLPGATSITFSLDDTDVNCSATINVANASMFTSAPVASRASGTAVYRYSEVQLTCDTEDAVIYYTTDGTCPCDENGTRIIYDSPIVLSEPVTIMAMAVADGMIESDVVTFSYTIRTTTLSISMSEGWNWISHDMESAVSLTELGSDVTDVIGQDSEATGNDGSFTGTLSSMDADQSYKVKACSDTQIILNGYEYNGGTAKSLQEGCNWIGYPIDQTMTVTEAFAYADIEDGDCLVGQDGFTIFDDGQWVGTLEVMNPGEGFLYYSQSAKDITYNMSIVSKAKSLYGKASKTATYWAVDKHAYPNILCLVANVYSDGTLVDEDAYTIGAFSGTECRGVGTYVDGKLMMNIYGDEGETITFVAMDNETETCYNIIESEVFVETVKGSLTSPYSLNIGDDLSGITNVESHLRIYPLVVYDLLYVESYEKIDKLLVFDISGNVVMTATNLHTGESVSLQMLPEGIYIVSAHSAGNVLYRKITKTDRAQ